MSVHCILVGLVVVEKEAIVVWYGCRILVLFSLVTSLPP